MEQELVEKEILRKLHVYIDQLPEKQKIVTCMFYTGEMKTEEIAKALQRHCKGIAYSQGNSK